MRSYLLATLLLMPAVCCSQEPTGHSGNTEPPLTKADYVRCLSHMERASQQAMFKEDFRNDAAKAMECDTERMSSLTTEQILQYARASEMFLVQIQAPSAIAHMQVSLESQKFLMMLK